MDATSQRRQKIRIGELLLEHRLISESQLQQALAEQKKLGRKLGRVVVEMGFVSEDALLELLSRQLQIPYVDLQHYPFKKDVVGTLPETHARRYRAIVLERTAQDVRVGMADPTDIFGYDELCRLLDRPVRLALVRENDLLRALDLVYRRTEEISNLAGELDEEMLKGDYDLAQLVAGEEQLDAPVIKLLRSVFEDALQVRASDIHIEPDERCLRIRQRIDGVLQEQVIEGRRIASALVTRLKLMSGLDISEKRMPQDGRFSLRVRERSIDVRLSTMPIQYGESVVMRLLDQSTDLLELDQLGMPEALLERFKHAIEAPQGLILTTGPTGSGKTTTMYAALNHINTAALKVITVEDPVEYRLERINQIQVNTRIGLDFGRVLRSGLRQDPDVIMVGEIRDTETAEIALRASMTGHLVLSTVHTNDAVSTVSRLLDMRAEGYLIAAALRCVVAQRLVRRICDACSAPDTPDPQRLAWLQHVYRRAPTQRPEAPPQLMRGRGCTYCNGTGYRGRVGVYELLELAPPLIEALRHGDDAAFARLATNTPGFRSFVSCAAELVVHGVTTIDEAIRIGSGLERYLEAEPAPADAPANA